ncbi:MAG: transposase [Terriglobia bacterium]
MARPLRISRPGIWYHVTVRGNERRAIYRDETDRQKFLGLLEPWVERYRLRLHAYVLMENHYHLLVETREANLSRAMQWLNLSYSQWYNRRHQRVGHLFQGRFGGIVVEEERWGLELSRYLHLNPVRRQRFGLEKRRRQQNRRGAGRAMASRSWGERVKALRAYRWSSYRAYVGEEALPEWLVSDELLSRMGGRRAGWKKAYQRSVEEELREGIAVPWEELKGQVILGDEEFVKDIKAEIEGDGREQPSLRQLEKRPSWEKIVKVVEQLKKEGWERFQDRRGDWGRDLGLYLGRQQGGMGLKELGSCVGIDYVAVSAALRRFERRLHEDKALARRLRQAESLLSNVETLSQF